MNNTISRIAKSAFLLIIALLSTAYGAGATKPFVIKKLSIGQSKETAIASLKILFPGDDLAFKQETDFRPGKTITDPMIEVPARRLRVTGAKEEQFEIGALVTIEWDEKELISKISFTRKGVAEAFGAEGMSPKEFGSAILRNYPVQKLDAFSNDSEIGWRGISDDRSTTIIIVKAYYSSGFGRLVRPSWQDTLQLRLEKAADMKKFD